MRKIKKILVANRGEISLRIMRTAKEMGIHTVAVFSEADRNALHVQFADEAVCLGPAPSTLSYLSMEKIIHFALELNVDAIHPGYGFLSENSSFAKKVAEAGLIFIGPSPDSIQIMGDKLAAKEAVSKYRIPMVPGSLDAIINLEHARTTATEIGYPILIKASAGGGGKGMRIVEQQEDLENQMQRAISEAESAFGDGRVFMEKYISSPRHIEIQILGDQMGNIVHLFERECSIQRRHQKVIEEAPSSVLDQVTRDKMGTAAVLAAKSCGYYGAGTVEFIVDQDLNFFFLEMNTRLQVEHPVTEMITGKDLVREQILIAEGLPLSFSQDQLQIHGHAIEVRVYAEDPINNFLPDVGKLITYRSPQGPGIRVDDGFEAGMDIPVHYDPMIAKLIVWDENRDSALKKMIRAIEEFQISGIATTLDFCKFVIRHEKFISGEFDTKFIEKYYHPDKLEYPFSGEEEEILAAFAVYRMIGEKNRGNENGIPTLNPSSSNWKNRKKNG